MSSLQPVRAESLSAQVAESIREAIFSGELKPGQVLRELGLAKNMNVSQATVREALSHLEHYGLVVRTPNRSTSVSSLSREDVQNRASIWLTLESRIWEQSVQASQDLLLDLTGIVSNMDDSNEVASTRRFHARVWESTGNGVLVRILDQLTTPLFAFGRLNGDDAGKLSERCRRMLDGMRSADTNAAQQALRDQVEAIEKGNTAPMAALEEREASASA
ncbi:MAG: GntR family transcriptional regulator [Acidobacteria bacterium]|nr:GntR family transcriptional regulator [Acidobacteriota bacterium]